MLDNNAINIDNKSSKEFSTSNYLPKINFAKKQKTISKSIKFKGIGLHSGKKVEMIIRPANSNTGIVFKVKKGPNSFIDIKFFIEAGFLKKKDHKKSIKLIDSIQFKKKLQFKDFKVTPGAKKRIEDLGGSTS